MYRLGQKVRPQTHGHNSIKLNRLTIFSLEVSFVNLQQTARLSKIPSLLAYVATLPCKTLMSENKRFIFLFKER